ncbi:hypothetical protein [Streptomyces sp. T028]|uniref:hypothetical protein n=1 Tax=Streptomyces sp. T028 TaxID=3394379 RepID=UPI003A8C64FD
MIKRIRLRTRRSRAARSSAVLTLLVAFLAIAFLQVPLGTTQALATTPSPDPANDAGPCPGGSSSGQGYWPCPNLRNQNLLNQRPLPLIVVRGDSRPPSVIFNNGFGSQGSNNDIQRHVHGGSDTNYISTTRSLSVAEPFARSQGLRNIESAARTRCAQAVAANDVRRGWIANIFPSRCRSQTRIEAFSYVYEIDTVVARNALYVPSQVRGNSNLYNAYHSQLEWAYVHRIAREAIRGVRVYRMTATVNGTYIDLRSQTFAFYRYDRNWNYNEHATPYAPNSDSNSHFTNTSNLNIPRLQANPYTRGCSYITRCRGGGN